MLYHVSALIVFVLFLPVLLNIILPLGMLAAWPLWRCLKHLVGNQQPATDEVGLASHGFTAR